MDFFNLDDGEFDTLEWIGLNSPHAHSPASPSPAPASASSQGSPAPMEPSLPMLSSSPPGPSDAIPPTNGENLEPFGPTASGRVAAKQFLLTWSQAPPAMTREVIADHLSALGPIECLAVGMEKHQDGATHFHAFVQFRKKLDKRPTAFALLGRSADVRTVQKNRGPLDASIHRMWKYCLKEDQTPLILGTPPPPPKRKRAEVYLEAMTIAATPNLSVEAGLECIRQNDPVNYLQKLDSMSRALASYRTKMLKATTMERTLTEFAHAPVIPDNWRVLYLWGATGVGKTQFAKALLPGAAIVSHTDQLKDCDFSKGVIFDDYSVGHWPPTSVIHLVDWDEPRGIHCRYAHVVIPPHTRKIITFNRCMEAWCPLSATQEQVDAVRRRMMVFEINDPLF